MGAGLAGATGAATGFFVSGFGASAKPIPSATTTVHNVCLSTLIVSGAMVVASVPLLSAGYMFMDKSVDTFNRHCNRTPLELSMHMTATGAGLALNF